MEILKRGLKYFWEEIKDPAKPTTNRILAFSGIEDNRILEKIKDPHELDFSKTVVEYYVSKDLAQDITHIALENSRLPLIARIPDNNIEQVTEPFKHIRNYPADIKLIPPQVMFVWDGRVYGQNYNQAFKLYHYLGTLGNGNPKQSLDALFQQKDRFNSRLKTREVGNF